MAADVGMTFRLPAEMRDAFVSACQANDETAAQVLRRACREYLERNAQPALPLDAVGKRKGRKPR